MVSLGYALLSEEHDPDTLIENARLAEEAGFAFAVVSDHYHPWTPTQGQSPFVWAVLGALAKQTERMTLGTGVTCPTIRMHPAIVAQAAATVACMAPDRFFLGVGTGERLNEHVLGDPWPSPPVRREMLDEAVEVIRELWTGEMVNHQGAYYTVERARIYTLPQTPPPVLVAAGGEAIGSLAGEIGDGLISTSPNADLVRQFDEAGNGRARRPRIGMTHCCWAESEEEGLQTMARQWPNAALGGQLGQEIGVPEDFAAAAQHISADTFRGHLACGPDPQPYVDLIRSYVDAGFDHVFIHQVGHQQAGFIDFFRREVMPQFELEPASIVRAD